MSDPLRKAAGMALVALNSFDPHDDELWYSERNADEIDSAITALRQALAQPEQEQPKHWSDCAVYNEPAYPKGECDCGGFDPNNKWHGLTEEEAEKIAFGVIADGVSKILAQPEQKPVAWLNVTDEGERYIQFAGSIKDFNEGTKFYTTPPSREWVGLTKEEKFKVLKEFFGNSQGMIDAVEAKLKEKNT